MNQLLCQPLCADFSFHQGLTLIRQMELMRSVSRRCERRQRPLHKMGCYNNDLGKLLHDC